MSMKFHFKRNWPVWLTFILGIALIAMLFYIWSLARLDYARNEFIAQTRDFKLSFEERFVSAVHNLEAIQSFYNASNEVSPDEFDTFIAPLVEFDKVVVGGAWVAKLNAKNKTKELATIRTYFPDFKLTKLSKAHRVVPDNTKMFPKFPVVYLLPKAIEKDFLGLNMALDSKRYAAIVESARSGNFIVSQPLKLAISQGASSGYVIFAPVYFKDLPLSTPSMRWEHLQGVIALGIQMRQLIDVVKKRLGFSSLEIAITDKTDSSKPIVVVEAQQLKEAGYFQHAQNFKFLNRTFGIKYSVPYSHFKTPYSWEAYLVLFAALLSLILLCVYIRTIIFRSALIKRQVAQRTKELEKVNLALVEEMDARQIEQEKLAKAVVTDSLCQLPNRLAFDRMLQTRIDDASKNKSIFTLYYIDLDHFKDINDTYGHYFGDQLLIQTAERLKITIGENDFIARLSSDEFAIIREHEVLVGECQHFARTLFAVFEEAFVLDDVSIQIKCTIGAVTYPASSDDPQTLMKYADIALVSAKDNMRGGIVFFDAILFEQYHRRSQILQDLPVALERGEIYVVFQPQFDMRNNQLIGAEALMRWQHQNMGVISPTEFIPLAEESGVIKELGLWMIEAACIQYKKWTASGLTLQSLSVNVSPAQLLDTAFISNYFSIVESYQIDHKVLWLELTETDIMGHQGRLEAVLFELTHKGANIYIDDFGTGASSLGRLKNLPVNGFKIDTSFVADALTDEGSATIIKAIIALAQELRLKLVAEGVETEAQKEFLLAQGCYVAQGYYYSKPISAEDLYKMKKNK